MEALRQVPKRMHCPLEAMLLCVRWCAAYLLSLRHAEGMMAERGVIVDNKDRSRNIRQRAPPPCRQDTAGTKVL